MILRVLCLACFAAVLSACSSGAVIPVNNSQTLVIESSLLVAGITAERPVITHAGVNTLATTSLYNESNKPVTVHYRFYWYDKKGLEMHPLDTPHNVIVPPAASVDIHAITQQPGADQARVYLYL
ncbi:YcfL family protein [Mangrovibacter yixingensis]|uniref:YcfL family protein n=1 Tax=Mangrovibacter yixingensis TaxID=1529639 RepID=UPI0021F6154A